MIALLMLMASVSPAGSTSPATTEEEVWALAQKVNTPGAYDLYVKRFRNSVHTEEASKRYWILQGKQPPPPAPPAPPPVITPLPLQAVDACTRALIESDGPTKTIEAVEFLAAQQNNRVLDYEAFVRKFPQGVCRTRAERTIEARVKLKESIKPIAGFGPLSAMPKMRSVIGPDDYPVDSIRNDEQGRVVVDFNVSQDGVVELCRISQSSGYAKLDDATCRLITRRLRYDPARDERGVPIRASDQRTINWALEQDPLPAASTSPR